MKFENDLNTEKTKSRISRWYVFAGTATAAFLGWGTLNTTGFCFSEMRYVPDQEFFARFLESNEFFLHPEVWQIRNATNDPTVVSVLTYKDGADYLNKNPDCCSYGPQRGTFPESDPPVKFLQQFLGIAWGDVALHYRIKYLDKAGVQKEYKYFPQYWADSCGKQVHSF